MNVRNELVKSSLGPNTDQRWVRGSPSENHRPVCPFCPGHPQRRIAQPPALSSPQLRADRYEAHDKGLGGLPPGDDDPRRRPADRACFCGRDRRSVAHPPLARRRRLPRPGSKALSLGDVDYVGGLSRCGDRRVRTLLYEAANVMLTRDEGQLKLKDWAFAIARRSTMRKAGIALARILAIIMHAMLRNETELAPA
jgi:hypothetical protein